MSGGRGKYIFRSVVIGAVVLFVSVLETLTHTHACVHAHD